MRVDGVLVTWLGGGNAFVDVMLTLRACEQRGIHTALVTYELGGKNGIDPPLLHYVPEADAIVSTGSRDPWRFQNANQTGVGRQSFRSASDAAALALLRSSRD